MTKLYSILFLALMGASSMGSVFAKPAAHGFNYVKDKVQDDHPHKDDVEYSLPPSHETSASGDKLQAHPMSDKSSAGASQASGVGSTAVYYGPLTNKYNNGSQGLY